MEPKTDTKNEQSILVKRLKKKLIKKDPDSIKEILRKYNKKLFSRIQ